MENKKHVREHGIFYTNYNPFGLRPFKSWAKKIGLENNTVLEPFAGTNNIIKMLRNDYKDLSFCSYDILPKNKEVQERNTMTSFPSNFNVCITNPPWLTSYSAKRLGVKFPKIKYDDVYKNCLSLALENCENVAFIVPATYLRTNLFRDRLDTVIFINHKLFDSTENPTCIALFTKQTKEIKIYYDNKYIGILSELEKEFLLESKNNFNVRFNSPNGKLGLFCVDNTKKPSIRFCRGEEIGREVKHSDRLITRIDADFKNDIDETVGRLNDVLCKYREATKDVFLAPFKGLRKDNQYRRRLDYFTAKQLISNYA